MEGYLEKKDLFVTFIDPEEVYDRVNSNKVWKLLEEYKVEEYLVNSVIGLSEGRRAPVRVEQNICIYFEA